MHHIDTFTSFERLYKGKGAWILFKHSPSCPISGSVYAQVQAFEKDSSVPMYLLNVLTTGTLKYEIADTVDITHQSPQIILFLDGKVVADASHGDITKTWLKEQIAQV